MTVLVLFFLVSIGFSFLCSILEAVILSVTPAYVNRFVVEQGTLGQLLKEYKADIDRPLSAILTLNTIAHTVGAIGVGAQAGKMYGTSGLDLGPVQVSYESVIAGLMTIAILVLSEIIPKTIGANLWPRLTPFAIRTIRIMIFLLWPFVRMSEFITKTLKNEEGRSVLSRADFAALTKAGAESGALANHESRIIHNLLRLEKLKAEDVMTPRTVMVSAPASQTVAEFNSDAGKMPFSRIPIYEDQPDHIVGLVLRNDILKNLADGHENIPLNDLKLSVKFISQDEKLPDILNILLKTRVHMVIVTDSFGGVAGLVTLEDIFETILGLEIVDETDTIEDLQGYARRSWEERAKKQGLL